MSADAEPLTSIAAIVRSDRRNDFFMSLNIGFILIAANLKTNLYLSPNLAKGSLTVLRKIVNTRAFFGEKHDNSVILLPFFGLLITEATLQQLHKHKKDIKIRASTGQKGSLPYPMALSSKIIGFMGKGRKRKMENGKGKRRELCRLPFSMKKMNALAAYLPNKYSDVKQTKSIMR